jgi:hypothetical protein
MKICVIIPTLGTGWEAAQSLQGDEVHIVRVFDSVNAHGEPMPNYMAARDNVGSTFFAEPSPLLPTYYNRVAHIIDADYYMAAADDMIMHTPNWFEAVKKALPHPSKPRLGQITDSSQGHKSGLAAYPIVTKGWVKATGRIFPEIFPYWYTDTWITDVADALGYKVPIELDYRDKDGNRGSTNRMRDLAFWSEVFAQTKYLRHADIRTILDYEQLSNDEAHDDLRHRKFLFASDAMRLELDYAKWAFAAKSDAAITPLDAEKMRRENAAYVEVVKNALALLDP